MCFESSHKLVEVLEWLRIGQIIERDDYKIEFPRNNRKESKSSPRKDSRNGARSHAHPICIASRKSTNLPSRGCSKGMRDVSGHYMIASIIHKHETIATNKEK